MKTTLKVNGMSCVNCEAAVKNALNEVDGVEDVTVDLASGNVEISLTDKNVTKEKLVETIEDQGYDVEN